MNNVNAKRPSLVIFSDNEKSEAAVEKVWSCKTETNEYNRQSECARWVN